ncbi:hypothetical protein HS125_08225 [bacterium]|nr:hypothetical protein [bacterium]
MTIVGDKKMLVYDDIEPLEKIKIYDKRAEGPSHYDTFAEPSIHTITGTYSRTSLRRATARGVPAFRGLHPHGTHAGDLGLGRTGWCRS